MALGKSRFPRVTHASVWNRAIRILEGNMPTSTSQVAMKNPENEASGDWRSDVSRKTSANPRHFAPLTAEETITYRKWKRATLAFYGALAFAITALLIVIGPDDSSINAGNKAAHRALASAGQQNPR
jgi:hypothetical protein